MTGISSSTNTVREPWAGATQPTTPDPSVGRTAATPAQTRAAADAAYGAALERLPSPAVTPATTPNTAATIGAKLDAVRASAGGPYRVDGATVEAPAQFRMVGGYNQAQTANRSDTATTLYSIAKKAGLASDLPHLVEGRGTLGQLTKVTQALIDGGQLERGGTKSTAERIHDLQWRFGIGLDCAGYVYRGLEAIHGDVTKLGLKAPYNEDFTGLPQNRCFTKVDPESARPGDVLVLKGAGGHGDPGHNLLVRSHAIATTASTGLLARWPQASQFIDGSPHVHAIEVDSSFGAEATGRPDGGVRRDVLLYDDRSGAWCTLRDTSPRLATTGSVPYGEVAVTGFFRAKVTP